MMGIKARINLGIRFNKAALEEVDVKGFMKAIRFVEDMDTARGKMLVQFDQEIVLCAGDKSMIVPTIKENIEGFMERFGDQRP